MKPLFLSIVLLFTCTFAFPQINFPVDSSTTPLQDGKWDLNLYVWSHARHKNFKNDKPPLDFYAIDRWPGIGRKICISPDGKYIAFDVEKGSGLPSNLKKTDSIVIQSTDGPWRIGFGDTKLGYFSSNNKQYVFLKGDTLCFLSLGKDSAIIIKDVASLEVPNYKDIGWIAYKIKGNDPIVKLKSLNTGKEKIFNGDYKYKFDNTGDWLLLYSNATKVLQLHNIGTGKNISISSVDSYVLSKLGGCLLFKNEKGGVSHVNLATTKITDIWMPANTTQLLQSFNQDVSGRQVVFTVHDRLEQNSTIWYWKEGMNRVVKKMDNQSKALGTLFLFLSASFTDNGKYIQLSIQPLHKVQKPQDDAVQLNIWSHHDKILQSRQPSILKFPLTYTVIFNLETNAIVKLENDNSKLVRGNDGIKNDFAIVKNRAVDFHDDHFWMRKPDNDSSWLVSLKEGKRRLLPARIFDYSFQFSPGGKYLVYFSEEHGSHYFSYHLATGNIQRISAGIPDGQLSYVDSFKRPAEPTGLPSGIAAWLENDKGVLVYDKYDIWLLDLTGRSPATNFTNGYGASHKTVICYAYRDHQGTGPEKIISRTRPILLKAFNLENKNSGYFVKSLGKKGDPKLLFMGPYYFQFFNESTVPGLSRDQMGLEPLKAENAEKWIVQRQTAIDAPNYFITNDFKKYKQLTYFNPEKGYNWLNTELFSFQQLDGTLAQGVLYKPENFDASKRYPVIVSLYGQLSDRLHQYQMPQYISSPSIFNEPAWLVSHGYLVIVVDIYFDRGKWGPSVLNTVEGAARYLRTLAYVDGEKIGLTGHSNSGLWAYYILTHSRSFAAVAVGAAVTNVISGAFRINSEGQSNLELTEISQYGTGLGNLWENKQVWLDHIHVLNADKVNCPLLIFHNDNDGITLDHPTGMFIALQRLNKPVWWLEYNEGGHVVRKLRDLRDFTIRYTQYFDHFLKSAPAPQWMTKGIPFSLKGVETRFDLDTTGQCNLNCTVCRKVE